MVTEAVESLIKEEKESLPHLQAQSDYEQAGNFQPCAEQSHTLNQENIES